MTPSTPAPLAIEGRFPLTGWVTNGTGHRVVIVWDYGESVSFRISGSGTHMAQSRECFVKNHHQNKDMEP